MGKLEPVDVNAEPESNNDGDGDGNGNGDFSDVLGELNELGEVGKLVKQASERLDILSMPKRIILVRYKLCRSFFTQRWVAFHCR